MKEQIFSIIIPVYNAEKTIERTLASLISNKDYVFEVIIVNDRCTDNTLEKIEPFKVLLNNIKVLNNEGEKGPGPARKTGILAAKGKYVTFLDSDDCLTPSSLYYVYNKIKENLNCTIVHTKTIFYESGTFIPENVAYCDNSCGGNFYRLKYLKKNKLYPHDKLFMSEDEYFNKKIELFMDYCEKDQSEYVIHFDYPVYEVHHDQDVVGSLATSSWEDYSCKYHLLFIQYIVEDMIQYEELKDVLKNELIEGTIFVYYICCGLIHSRDEKFNLNNYKEYFLDVLNILNNDFDFSDDDLIWFYNANKDITDNLRTGAINSCGVNFKDGEGIKFENFIKKIRDQT